MAFCSKYKLNIFDAGKHLMVNDIEAKAKKTLCLQKWDHIF